ncbi:MAG: DUF6636 domain-containing protein [Thermoleophilia bacterium]
MRRIAVALSLAACGGLGLAASASASPLTQWWHSPDDNIACSYFRAAPSVDCQTQNNLRVVILRHEKRATVGKGIYVGAPGRVLGFGRTIQKGGFVCTSRRAYMQCYSRVSGHGFRIWASGYSRIRVAPD